MLSHLSTSPSPLSNGVHGRFFYLYHFIFFDVGSEMIVYDEHIYDDSYLVFQNSLLASTSMLCGYTIFFGSTFSRCFF